MTSYINEVGNVYGLLTVDRLYQHTGLGTAWICVCECGNEVAVKGTQLRSGCRRSCGCLRKMSIEERKKRGLWRSEK